VTARVTTTITTATNWSLGDSGSAARYLAATTDLTAGTVKAGVAAAHYWNATAAKVRITTTGTPGAGKIRVAVHYRVVSAPTS
jgi:hypothetical protein